mmetsp:Transcript_139947/g.447581  ORF Transcript_139947/g.447581 Transcript_139947/m.447581 type:complete len:212 (+) Transcript_139947:371-1006(+)
MALPQRRRRALAAAAASPGGSLAEAAVQDRGPPETGAPRVPRLVVEKPLGAPRERRRRRGTRRFRRFDVRPARRPVAGGLRRRCRGLRLALVLALPVAPKGRGLRGRVSASLHLQRHRTAQGPRGRRCSLRSRGRCGRGSLRGRQLPGRGPAGGSGGADSPQGPGRTTRRKAAGGGRSREGPFRGRRASGSLCTTAHHDPGRCSAAAANWL